MKRAAAIIGALAMIGLALVVRDLIEGGDGRPGGPEPRGPVHLLCATEVEAACQEVAAQHDDVEVTVQDVGETLATVEGGSLREEGYDAWVTLRPLSDMADITADRAVFDADATEVVASSPVVVVAPDQRADALLAECGDPPAMRCVAETAGQPWNAVGGDSTWGRVKPGLQDPLDTASGLAALQVLAEGWFAEEEIGSDFASNDFDPAFRAYLSDVEEAQPNTPGDPLTVMVQQGPAAYGWVLALEAEVETTVVGSRAEDDLTVLYPAPMAEAAVVLAPVSGAAGADDATRLAEDLTAALGDTGWDIGDPAAVGLPGAGVSIALQEEWA